MLRHSGSPLSGFPLLIIITLLLAADPLRAQELLYSPPKDYLADVSKGLTLLTAVLAIGLVSWVFLARRQMLDRFQTKMALFLGICVLPVPVMFMSTAVGLEQAKELVMGESD